MSASAFSASAIHEYTSLTGCADPNMMVVAPDGNTIFLCLGNYPAIERIENNGVGVAPTLTDYAVNTQTPNDVFQQTIDITIGPNGNLWTAQQTTGTLSPPNVLEMAY
jgi:streptogramin lyase